MRALRLSGLILLASAGSAVPAAAQDIYFTDYADSALIIVKGDSGRFRLYVNSASSGISAYSITLKFDDSRIQLIRANAYGSLPAATITPGVNEATVAAAGTGFSGSVGYLAELWFRMLPGAVEGSLVSMRVNALSNFGGGSALANHKTTLMDVCHAPTYWGDLSGEKVVNSRDALIALTKAVGGSTGAFDTRPGDVDGDGYVTSRDALAILSYSIQSEVYEARTGFPMADRCAPLLPQPQDLVFYRNYVLNRINAGDSIPQLVNVPVGVNTNYRPALSPNGARVLFNGYASVYGDELMAVNGAGVVDTLTRNVSGDYAGDWSPDGSLIAFLSDRVYPRAVFTMSAGGGPATQVTSSAVDAYLTAGTNVVWSPDGTRLALIGCASACGNPGVWTVGINGSGLTQVVVGATGYDPRHLAWTPAGDSLVFSNASGGQGYIVAATAAATPQRLSRLYRSHVYTTVSTLGPSYQSDWNFAYDFYVRRNPDDRVMRLLRNTYGNDRHYSYRRAAGSYVSDISVAPPTQSVQATLSFGATATVTNSDASTNSTAPVTWISRNPGVATASPTGLQTANIEGVSQGTTWVIGTVGGWRSDSTEVTVTPSP